MNHETPARYVVTMHPITERRESVSWVENGAQVHVTATHRDLAIVAAESMHDGRARSVRCVETGRTWSVRG